MAHYELVEAKHQQIYGYGRYGYGSLGGLKWNGFRHFDGSPCQEEGFTRAYGENLGSISAVAGSYKLNA